MTSILGGLHTSVSHSYNYTHTLQSPSKKREVKRLVAQLLQTIETFAPLAEKGMYEHDLTSLDVSQRHSVEKMHADREESNFLQSIQRFQDLETWCYVSQCTHRQAVPRYLWGDTFPFHHRWTTFWKSWLLEVGVPEHWIRLSENPLYLSPCQLYTSEETLRILGGTSSPLWEQREGGGGRWITWVDPRIFYEARLSKEKNGMPPMTFLALWEPFQGRKDIEDRGDAFLDLPKQVRSERGIDHSNSSKEASHHPSRKEEEGEGEKGRERTFLVAGICNIHAHQRPLFPKSDNAERARGGDGKIKYVSMDSSDASFLHTPWRGIRALYLFSDQCDPHLLFPNYPLPCPSQHVVKGMDHTAQETQKLGKASYFLQSVTRDFTIRGQTEAEKPISNESWLSKEIKNTLLRAHQASLGSNRNEPN